MTNHCGTCTACCRVYAVPEIDKPAGPWCQHCAVGSGCKIYDSRPQMCVDFECLWLQSQSKPGAALPIELRPDRSKVVISPTTNPNIISAITMPGASDAWRRGPVRRLLDSFVQAGMRVTIGSPGARYRTMLHRSGEYQTEMTAPDHNGMQWNVEEQPE